MLFVRRKCLLYIYLLCSFASLGQSQPIGSWSSLLPYNSTLGVATDGTTLFAICNQAFFTYNNRTGDLEPYSKVNGMADIGMQCIGYDKTSKTAVLVYSNGNIDLFKNNNFINIPDFKNKTVAGAKNVYQVYTENGFAYLSTSLGIVVIDLTNQTFSETYQFYANSQLIPILGFTGSGSYFYAATGNGLYRASKNSPDLQNFQIWQKIDSTHTFNSMVNLNDSLFLSGPQSVYTLSYDTIRQVFSTGRSLSNINAGLNTLFISEFHPYNGDIKVMDLNYHIIDSITLADSQTQIVQLTDSSIWTANYYTGLSKYHKADSSMNYFYPVGPCNPNSMDIVVNNNNIWIAHGGYDDLLRGLGNDHCLSNFHDGMWSIYSRGNYYPFNDSMRDFTAVTKDPLSGIVYGTSYEDGLFQLKPDGSYSIFKQGSFLDPSDGTGGTIYHTVGAAFDNNNNLWVTTFEAYDELYVRDATAGTWSKFHLTYGRPYQYSGGPMVFDNANDVWYACTGGGGVVAYSTNNTLADPTDDKSYRLSAGVGAGNLPSNVVNCIAHDKNDNIWIGTDNGIGIVYNASGCIGSLCDAEIPIVQYDQFAGYLFSGEDVTAMAVDGANRKWVGTHNGVWLLSPDPGNSSIIYRFTKDNSPLPSNIIQKIAIDGATGVVYIGTDQGLVTFRSTAVEGGTTNSGVTTFPNPVPSGYKGTIAIRGLVANADVRITDINGQLVYKTTALGGQAVWNGLDYLGHRPQSGVYLIFASSSDGSQTYAGKMVFMQ